MDEIDWIKNTKKAFILFIKMFCGFGLIFMLIMLIASKGEDIGNILLAGISIGIVPPLFVGLCYGIIYIIDKVLKLGRTETNWDRGYIRELPKHCSPAISSLVYDLKIDVFKDYTATILYLCFKKYIKLIKVGEHYEIQEAEQKDFSTLGRCEKYVLDIIKNKNKFDEVKFKEEIIKEAQEKNLIIEKKHALLKRNLKIIIPIILLIVIAIIDFLIGGGMLITIISFIITDIYMFFQNKPKENDYKRTSDGEKVALLLGGLKRYINEYTLIKDKEIDYIQILENYIPYALALGEADAVEEFIKYNEEYRDLIYNRRSMQ